MADRGTSDDGNKGGCMYGLTLHVLGAAAAAGAGAGSRTSGEAGEEDVADEEVAGPVISGVDELVVGGSCC